MGQFATGQAVPRTEDPRLLRGEGGFVDDVRLAGEAHATMLRSPHAHAEIASIDVRAAQRMPGVLGVFTGKDWARAGLGQHRTAYSRVRRDGAPLFYPPHPALPSERVRFVGEAVAMVVAETLEGARDTAEAIVVGYEPLPPVIVGAKARRSAPLHDGCPDNECFFYKEGDVASVDAAFARARHVTRLHLEINRVTAATIEPRAAVADYDRREERYTLHAATQLPHALRRGLAEHVLRVPETLVRVVSTDVGGSFGMKGGHFPEHHLLLWASRSLGRPVRWVCERGDGMMSDAHDRDQVTDAELALDEDGTFLAMRVRSTCAIGGYAEPAGVISPCQHIGGIVGTYLTPAVDVEVSAVFTNTAPNGPYRGSGRAEATYVMERLIDAAARETGIDRAELRRRNMVPPERMPFKTGLIFTLDSGDFPRNFADALGMADYDGFETRRAEARTRGRLRGIGMSNFIEQTAQSGGETVTVRFDPTGTVTVLAGSAAQGQGHETMYKIVLSDRLGIDADDIRVTSGDTDGLPYGGGTYGSRTAVLGGSAASLAADKIVAHGRRIAAHLLEAGEDDVEFADGTYRIAGTDRTVALKEVAEAAYQPARLPPGMEPGLFENAAFFPSAPTLPNGCHVVEVEIDPETGICEVLRYSVVDDVGTVINALTLEGQIHGGIGQGIGQAFSERIVYDEETGQLLTGSFLDYGLPRADDMPSFDCANNPVPTRLNPLGVKGAGEAGNVGALGAIMNAVVDALSPLGVAHIDMPATPERVWRAIRDANAG